MIRFIRKFLVLQATIQILQEFCNASQGLNELQELNVGGKYLVQSKLDSVSEFKLPVKSLQQDSNYELRITYYGYDALEFDIKICDKFFGQLSLYDMKKNKRNRILDNHNYYLKTHENSKYFEYVINGLKEDCRSGVFDEKGQEYYIVKIKPYSHTFINKKTNVRFAPVKFVINFIVYDKNEQYKRAFTLIIVCGVIFQILGLKFKQYFIPNFFDYKKITKN